MGLTYKSVQKDSLTDVFDVKKKENEFTVALAGNPNTGKSTVFNSLTGLHQHTGNWPGKTVVNARGRFKYKDIDYILVDLPGTYSIFASSVEELVARDFLCFGLPNAAIVVTDATCLERNLNLFLQVMELNDNVILCINLIDEAKKKNITIDAKGIEKYLGVPVVLTAARNNIGIKDLKEALYRVSNNIIKCNKNIIKYDDYIENTVDKLIPIMEENIPNINSRWLSLRFIDGDSTFIESMCKYIDKDLIYGVKNQVNLLFKDIDKEKVRESLTEKNYKVAEYISNKYVTLSKEKILRDAKIDNFVTSKIYGIPLMLITLAMVFWITIEGANIPSEILANILFGFENVLSKFMISLNAPSWLNGILVLGLYKTLAWVVSVMLPPMAIFFPIFTLLEDLGYLPRIAFNLDHLFKKACAHGKQCLTMCMGLGCNAAGIVGCRIIESPRERLIAILTNNFVPCNGRFPTLIAISTVFLVANPNNKFSGFLPALIVTLLVIVGISITLLVSYILSKTLLKGIPSSFTLELPPYRKPQIGRVLYTSIIDRTIFVLMRAATVAAPAGAITWLLANIYIGNLSILTHCANFLSPLGNLIGLDGYILIAFILGFPANEIVLPILLMAYLSTGTMVEFDSIQSLRQVLLNHNWTYLTALNLMLFSLLHWPCATTLWTIKKETGSIKWTSLAVAIPTTVAFVVCFITTTIFRLL